MSELDTTITIATPEPPAAAPEPPAAPAPAQPAAPEPPAAPETPNAYDSIISQQTEQINALIAQNQSLTNQITQLVQNGAQIGQPATQTQQVNPLQQLNPPALSENDDWSLEELGREMAKESRH